MSLFDPLGTIQRKVLAVAAIAGGLVLLGLLTWGLRLDDLRGRYKAGLEQLAAEATGVLAATRVASSNPELNWESVPGQVIALGEDRRDLEASVARLNRTVLEMAEDAVRLRAEAAERTRIAERARAQRDAAYKRLGDLSITPATRTDCMQLLREAEEAIDLLRQAAVESGV